MQYVSIKRTVKYGDKNQLSDTFPTKSGLKEWAALLSLLFNFALEYAIRKIKANHNVLKFSGTHQVIVYADDVNLQGQSIYTINFISPS
jgi:hypothetical protein